MRTKLKLVKRKRSRKSRAPTFRGSAEQVVKRIISDLKKAKLSVALHQEIKVIMRTLKRNERALKRYI